MAAFNDVLKQYNWNDVTRSILNKTRFDVEKALAKRRRDLEDFKALISPAARAYLPTMASMSQALTLQRFGKNMQLYIPLYLSNECANGCIYCGFNHANAIHRLTLTDEELLLEVQAIKKMGYEHVLLVSGEHPLANGFAYLSRVIRLVKPHFAQLSLEVAPMSTDEYKALKELGVHSVYIYQETYHRDQYKSYHPVGKKSQFEHRLATPERIGEADLHRVGLGCLLGLEDWRTDSFFTALHISFLEKKFWRQKFSISFPRLRPHTGSFQPNVVVSDQELFQLITAYRLCNENIEISLSTRENELFRDELMKYGVTAMSAGSRTDPGGYAGQSNALEQFAVSDDRSPEQVAQAITKNGYTPVWKDWDRYL
jgi:2-iminoacetate synthase